MSVGATLDVVICTYNNADMLDAALTALAAQQPIGRAGWNCLVVNNNCTDHTTAVVQKHAATGLIPGLRSVHEPEQGLTPARLCGVRSSTSPWIAFVDDDCLLGADWIAQALRFADSHAAIGAFGGRVVLDWAVEPPPYVRAYGYAFAEQDHGATEKPVPFLAGAGLVVSRAALLACRWVDGPLLEDRVGARLVSGGDVEIVLRIAGVGYELWYVPQCQLRHQIPARRTTLRYLIDINRGLGVSQALADALVWQDSGVRWMGISARKVARDFRSLAGVAVAVARRRRAAPELLIQGSFKLGQIQGLLRILRMSPTRRRGLMGRAHHPSQPGHGAPTKAA
jgi:glycosyltransferase involved in cell wall biosynthesis